MTIKTLEEIRVMERVCQLAAKTLYHTGKYVRPGITTDELDQIAYDFTLSHGARPAPLNYNGFPKSICTSVNEVVCHGVPDKTVLKEGDIINIDVTCFKDGFHGDTSAMFYVGEVSSEAKRLVECAHNCMMKGIEVISGGATTGDIGFAVQKTAFREGFVPVRDIGGHGIGREFHEEPFVPSFGKKGRGEPLLPYATITVEPMINETDAKLIEKDIPNSSIKWYVMADGCLSAQFEHTVLITESGFEIMTGL